MIGQEKGGISANNRGHRAVVQRCSGVVLNTTAVRSKIPTPMQKPPADRLFASVSFAMPTPRIALR